MTPDTARARFRVRSQVLSCDRCDLRSTCKSPVPFAGPSPSRIMIIGEAPGAEEDNQNKPFVGASGRLIRSLLSSHRVDPADVVITNSVRCRPPANRSPKNDELGSCRANLDAEISLASPTFIILLGATALSTVRPDLKVTQVHGHPFVRWMGGKAEIPSPFTRAPFYLPTFHPAAGLRDVNVKKQLESDIARFVAITRTANHLDLWPDTCINCSAEGFKQPGDLLTYCHTHMPKRSAKIPAAPGTRERQEVFV